MSRIHRDNPELFMEDVAGHPSEWDEDGWLDAQEAKADAAREASYEAEYEARVAQEEHDCDGMSKHEFEMREAEREGW